jgi:hypothetical protein
MKTLENALLACIHQSVEQIRHRGQRFHTPRLGCRLDRLRRGSKNTVLFMAYVG